VFSFTQDWVNFIVAQGLYGQFVSFESTFSSSTIPWGSPSVPFTSAPAAASWVNRYDLFAYDQHGHLGHMFQSGGLTVGGSMWEDWGPPPSGSFQFKPAVTSWGAGRLDVFATAAGRVFHRSQDAAVNSGWDSLPALPIGVTATSAPAAASGFFDGTGAPEVDVFVIGSDGNLYWNRSSREPLSFGAWSKFAPQGLALGPFAGDPVAASWGPGGDRSGTRLRLDVFIPATIPTGIYHFKLDGFGTNTSWDTWSAPVGTWLTGGLTATSMGTERLFVGGVSGTSLVEFWYDWGSVTPLTVSGPFLLSLPATAVAPTPVRY
jgi:hypothetical protein